MCIYGSKTLKKNHVCAVTVYLCLSMSTVCIMQYYAVEFEYDALCLFPQRSRILVMSFCHCEILF